MEKLYRKVEVPYRKGILFYGPPGTGKTSLVKAIAFEYQVPLYIIDVNAEGINDDTIVEILNSLGKNHLMFLFYSIGCMYCIVIITLLKLGGNGLKILLFEDIDTAFADKEKMAKEDKTIIRPSYIIDYHEEDMAAYHSAYPPIRTHSKDNIGQSIKPPAPSLTPANDKKGKCRIVYYIYYTLTVNFT